MPTLLGCCFIRTVLSGWVGCNLPQSTCLQGRLYCLVQQDSIRSPGGPRLVNLGHLVVTLAAFQDHRMTPVISLCVNQLALIWDLGVSHTPPLPAGCARLYRKFSEDVLVLISELSNPADTVKRYLSFLFCHPRIKNTQIL